MEKNIVLIGMPGAGKSTVGVVLAKRLGLDFVDSDLVIQQQEGKLLHQLITEQGLDGFLETENRINAALTPKLPSVIATGGSVIYGREAMEHFSQIAAVIYLKLTLSTLKTRLGDLNERGVALKEGQTLESLYEERIPLYQHYAEITINCEGKEIREIVEEIASELLR
ncbi:MAG: shikimate kinase [Lachnospiraceae bacterium]|nr:shikimate kinase [Lachnospiraceae bacterium]